MSVFISLITVCYNAEATIERCLQSVKQQQYADFEHIIIDGYSTDRTWAIINEQAHFRAKKSSAPDNGLYDAINKGIKLAKGEVVGLIHADDCLAYENVLGDVATAFENDAMLDAVFGNLNFYNRAGKLVRAWRSDYYEQKYLARGWMPPHPTFYVRRKHFEKYGYYDEKYGSAADYELMLRFLHTHSLKAKYLNNTLVHMQTGGISNRSFKNRLKASYADFKAIKSKGIKYPLWVVLIKMARKIKQWKH